MAVPAGIEPDGVHSGGDCIKKAAPGERPESGKGKNLRGHYK
nr:MAG TPA: hypothetical protein [Caudoviricetes sp.]